MIDIIALEGMPMDAAMLVPRDVGEQIRAAMADPRSAATRRVVDGILDEIRKRPRELAIAKFSETP